MKFFVFIKENRLEKRMKLKEIKAVTFMMDFYGRSSANTIKEILDVWKHTLLDWVNNYRHLREFSGNEDSALLKC